MNLITASFMLISALICLPMTVQAGKVIINAIGDDLLSDPLITPVENSDGRYEVLN